jgi:protoporphyrinogen oxidase
MRFIILGAGLSGLTCATTLRKHGHEVSVVEKEPAVGGLARSHRVNGFTFDYGPHFLFGEKVYTLLRNEFPEIELNRVDSTKETMYFREKYFNFPFDPKNILLHMEKREIPGVLFELFFKNVFKAGDTHRLQNVEDWVIQAVGKRIYRYISLGGYVQKLYGLPPTEISNEWGIQKLKFLAKWRDANLVKLVAQSFLEEGNARKRVIHYPVDGGIDHIPLRISETFLGLGGEILLNSEAVSVQHRGEGVSVTLRENGEQHGLDGDFLISTIPITQLTKILSPRLPTEISKKVTSLRYRTLLLLYLFIRKELVTSHHCCVYFTEDPFLFRRITEFKHLDTRMAPSGKSSLCIEITCFECDALYTEDKEKILNTVVEQLERRGYLKAGDIEGYHFMQIPFAYPVYEIRYGSNLEEILCHLGNYGNMISIGRQGLFFYNAMNSSIILGYELCKKLSISGKNGWEEVIKGTYRARIVKNKPYIRKTPQHRFNEGLNWLYA